MKTQSINNKFFIFTLAIIFIFLGMEGISYGQDLNVGEPRTVRMIYFLSKDRQYDAKVVQKMKDDMRALRAFFAEQMQAYGYGKKTFRFETDNRGNPKVHRVDGQYTDSYYIANRGYWEEINQKFDLKRNNIYFIVWDNSTNKIDETVGGYGYRQSKSVGGVVVPGDFSFRIAAHELGHAFGLQHDFRDSAYILSYGPGQNILSSCAAESLAVHPYFNLNIPLEVGTPPTIEIISPRTYSSGTESVTIQIKVKDPDGVHQVRLSGSGGLIACQGLSGKKEATVEFEYEGVALARSDVSLTDAVSHGMLVYAIDTNGDEDFIDFNLSEISRHHIATLEEEHTHRVVSLAFSPDGTTLASGSIAYTGRGTGKLWDVETQRNIATFEGRNVAFSPDGTTLASSHDAEIKLWDVASQTDIATLIGHKGFIVSLAFSPDGTTLASGSYDAEIKLWDVASQTDFATRKEHTESSYFVGVLT